MKATILAIALILIPGAVLAKHHGAKHHGAKLYSGGGSSSSASVSCTNGVCTQHVTGNGQVTVNCSPTACSVNSSASAGH